MVIENLTLLPEIQRKVVLLNRLVQVVISYLTNNEFENSFWKIFLKRNFKKNYFALNGFQELFIHIFT